VLSTPPAFVLSQDQTLHDIWKSVWLLFIDWYYSLFDVLYNRTSHVGVHSVHCSVFKGHRHHRLSRRLAYFNKLRRACQGCFLNFFKAQSPRPAWRRPRQDETPAVSGPCPDSLFSILLCKGYVKDFFQILDAGRRSPVAATS
jgi:hypothetical protein